MGLCYSSHRSFDKTLGDFSEILLNIDAYCEDGHTIEFETFVFRKNSERRWSVEWEIPEWVKKIDPDFGFKK